MPSKVKKEMRQFFVQRNKVKAKKAADIKEIRAELQGTMGGSHRHLVDNDDEDKDVYMYSGNMNPDERTDYQEACRASKASEWNRQQEEGSTRGKRKIGKSFNLNSFLWYKRIHKHF